MTCASGLVGYNSCMKESIPCIDCNKERLIDTAKWSATRYLKRSPRCRKCATRQPELVRKISKGWFTQERMKGNKNRLGATPWNKGVHGYMGANKTSFKKGVKPWNAGTVYEAIKGEKHHNWKGGVSPLRTAIYYMPEYKAWRKSVFERDNYTCVWCKAHGVELNADHFPIPFFQFRELFNITDTDDARACEKLWDISNGRTLCRPCHETTFPGRPKKTQPCVA